PRRCFQPFTSTRTEPGGHGRSGGNSERVERLVFANGKIIAVETLGGHFHAKDSDVLVGGISEGYGVIMLNFGIGMPWSLQLVLGVASHPSNNESTGFLLGEQCVEALVIVHMPAEDKIRYALCLSASSFEKLIHVLGTGVRTDSNRMHGVMHGDNQR